MARYSNDGQIRVQICTAISNIALPTTTELNAGTNITSFLTKDGLTTPADQNNVDTASLAETFNSQVVGSFGGAIEMTGMRDNSADTLWTLIVYGNSRFLVVRRGFPTATAFASAQPLEVYPCMFHEPIPDQTGGDEVSRFTIAAPVTSQPNLKAAVA